MSEKTLTKPTQEKSIKKPKKRTPLSKKRKITIGIIILVSLVLLFALIGQKKDKQKTNIASEDAIVGRQNITSSITGSAVVMPKEQYSITALVSGDVLEASFEQGDVVKEGDVLYKIDASDAQNSIENADISHRRSQMDYNRALENYNDLTVKSDISGVVKAMHVKCGDAVNTGSKIADIYDDSYLILTTTFNDADAQYIHTGDSATVRISSNGEEIWGTVTYVNAAGYAAEGNTLVRTVKIKVKNPSTLTNTETATATVGDFACASVGTFEYLSEKTITAQVGGEIDALYAYEGTRVTNGSNLVHIKSDTVSDALKSSQLSLQSSQLSRENAQKKLEDYTITAPISGTVVTKNVKAGDKLDSKNMSAEMAVIYDMSSLECELSVDELDIKNVKTNQSVVIKCDAVEGKSYNGIVTNVSVNGTTTNGVTTYPVTIEITDFDNSLLPGMNIDAEIITSTATNVLAVPVGAINRGNIVFVKGEKEDEKDFAPEGYRSVRVETGVYNNEFIEITSGLNEGDTVYVPQIQASTLADTMQKFGAMQGQGMQGGMPSGARGGGMQGGMPSGARGGGMQGGGMR